MEGHRLNDGRQDSRAKDGPPTRIQEETHDVGHQLPECNVHHVHADKASARHLSCVIRRELGKLCEKNWHDHG